MQSLSDIFLLPWRDAATLFWPIVVQGILVSCALGLLGCFLVVRGMSLLGDALSHAVLPGIAVGFFVSASFGEASLSSPWILVGASAFGLLGAAFGIGFIIGPALGGLIGELGTRAPFFVAAGLAGVTFLYGLLRFQETLPKERRRPFQWRRANPLGAILSLRSVAGLWPLAGAYLCWISAVNIYPVAWAWFASARFEWGPGMIGLSLVLTGLSMAFYQARIIGPLTARAGPVKAIRIGLAGAIAGFLFYMINPIGWLVLPVGLLLGIQGIIQPSLSALLSGAVDDDQQGELLGFNASLAALAAIIAPLAYNPLLAYFTSPQAPVHFSGAPFVLAALFACTAFVLISLRAKPSAGNAGSA